MVAISLLAALAATTAAVQADTAVPIAYAEAAPAHDAAGVAAALSGPVLVLTMRGTSVEVIAVVAPGNEECTALVSAHAPGQTKVWMRQFRWGDVAWLGSGADGRTTIAFFEPEGRMPADTVTFSPADADRFRESLARVSTACRAARAERERIAFGPPGPTRSCYFPRLPSLQLVDSPGAAPIVSPPRAILSVLARENPQAELQLLLERAVPDPAEKGDDWDKPTVAFIFADPRVKDMQIASARFALDGKPVTAQHAVAGYGDTRVRIIMDPFAPSATGPRQASFYRRLASSGEATLTLLDAGGQSRGVLHFDTGPVLAAARTALSAADWSCEGGAPLPIPAARWQRGK